MPIRDGERWLRTKENLTWSDDPQHAFTVPQPREFRVSDQSSGSEAIAPAIRAIGVAAVADHLNVDQKTVRRWLDGGRQPHDRTALIKTLVVLGRRADLFMQSEGDFTPETLLPLIPQRVEWLRVNVWYFVVTLVQVCGGKRGLARAMAAAEKSREDIEPTIRRWCAYSKLTRDRDILEAIIARLARFCRSEAVVEGRSRSPKLGTPAENRRVVLWYLSFAEDPNVDDGMVFNGADNLLIAVRFVGIKPDASFYESLADGEPRPWPVQLLANIKK